MVAIVRVNGSRHSIWNTYSEAIKQMKVLKDFGYKNVEIEDYYFLTNGYKNGHYFV